MKSPQFDYCKAKSLSEVFALMNEHGDDARILAGGQTLLATLNMRLSEPKLLIDINDLNELKGVTLDGSKLRIGALVTHTMIEASKLIAEHVPMLTLAAPHIAHRAIRNLGTLGGSLAYADPAAEWPACALALDADIILKSAKLERKVAAKDFFKGLYATAAQDDEIIIACEFPIRQAEELHYFSELARRHGDYAVVGLALRAQRARAGLSDLRIAFLGLTDRPARAFQAEQLLGQAMVIDGPVLTKAIESLAQDIDAIGDLTHQASTKLHMAGVLLRRTILQGISQ
jgi:aerobic carbon-monoxide dehydrogenase medium subunit